jgi:hypothetical protein
MERGLDIVPVARTRGLVVTESAGELLVYDQEQHHIHHLNPVSAGVWRGCTGNQSILDVAAATGLDIDQVRLALRQLAGANLLEGDLLISSIPSRSSRRALLKKSGIAVMIPAVVSVTAPLAAQATSPSSRYYKCSNNACADFSCSVICQASNICPGCTKDMNNLTCMNFDGPLVPDMCAVFCTCP